MKTTLIANITWNPDGWRNTYVNPKAGHRYARRSPGHESLNFKFDKTIDKNNKVHGHVQWTNPPKSFNDGGVIFFYSKNAITKVGEVVGVYGNAKIITPPLKTHYLGFEKNTLWSNIEADTRYSMLFPVPLYDQKYKNMLPGSQKGQRLVPQTGFRYLDGVEIGRKIISDEIEALKRSGLRSEEKEKLESIYELMTGEPYEVETNKLDENFEEQEILLNVLKSKKELDLEKLSNDLKNIKATDPELVEIYGKAYSRDSKTILSLKLIRGHKCQICNKGILKKDGSFYVEAAHILPKRQKGPELPGNILILCPNHHKEFDYGNCVAIEKNDEFYNFRLNGNEYKITLKL